MKHLLDRKKSGSNEQHQPNMRSYIQKITRAVWFEFIITLTQTNECLKLELARQTECARCFHRWMKKSVVWSPYVPVILRISRKIFSSFSKTASLRFPTTSVEFLCKLFYRMSLVIYWSSNICQRKFHYLARWYIDLVICLMCLNKLIDMESSFSFGASHGIIKHVRVCWTAAHNYPRWFAQHKFLRICVTRCLFKKFNKRKIKNLTELHILAKLAARNFQHLGILQGHLIHIEDISRSKGAILCLFIIRSTWQWERERGIELVGEFIQKKKWIPTTGNKILLELKTWSTLFVCVRVRVKSERSLWNSLVQSLQLTFYWSLFHPII